MSEMTDSKAVEALDLAIQQTIDMMPPKDLQAKTLAKVLHSKGYQILPTVTQDHAKQGSSAAVATQSPSIEQLREAFDTLLKENNGAKMAVEYQLKYDEWPLETIKAALSELSEQRALRGSYHMMMKEAFIVGFNTSGEGFNGEFSKYDDGKLSEKLNGYFNEWLKTTPPKEAGNDY